jgi:hypothetical protein
MIEYKRPFSKETTNITKGILIILMLIHHLFSDDVIENMGLIPVCDDVVFRTHFILYLRIILACFAFLSAFGIARGYKGKEISPELCLKKTAGRLISLFSMMLPIYVLAILYMRFVRGEHVKLLYVGAEGKFSLVYMLADMFGLSSYFGRTGFNITWWYLSYAFLLIVAAPLMVELYKKYRYAVLLPTMVLPVVLFKSDVHFAVLLPTAMLGIAFAWEDWFEKIHDYIHDGEKKVVKILGFALITILFYVVSWFAVIDLDMTYFFPMTIAFAFVAYEYVSYTRILKTVLRFLGENCTNIFLTHTLIYYYWYQDFIYSFKYTVLIFLVLMGISLAISVVLELLKKFTGYNKLVKNIITRITG